MPIMLTELLKSLVSSEPGLQFVEVAPNEPTLRAARREAVDVLVVQRSSARDDDACLADLLDDRPLSILAISEDGRSGKLWRVRPTNISFETLPNGFVRALRVAMQLAG
jgi:hypothetical protein